MASRHLSRSIAMQSLYEWDFNGAKDPHVLRLITQRNINEFGQGLESVDFIWELINGVKENQKYIDKIIETTAPEWPLSQINILDRNILRIGIYELIYGNKENVPPKVAINESIELAKNFGGESSRRFINGVLGTVYRGLEEQEQEHIEDQNKKEISLSSELSEVESSEEKN
ncbi:MAG TPA: transcription antitermination factor NusB [Candidatus Pacearchaeota archaeon]|nr:transcription antitermination factor NusB [Candidatus Pacearchaeota archaeon]HRR94996.1 transcription antitermination factor NusB [Candidatus Paceibacterota bacterium]HPC30802.1 transcription antitermination factor NusB [Candidatus Pacearchaeota archaeon]HQG09500.1 transcription antitermination factor NusB [Candidatus Pacearchaeota archaeon]HQH20446.1 transcription antitermination factor NusB [Candidatus Pacearchaeota archaeon]